MSDDHEQGPVPEHLLPAKKKADRNRRYARNDFLKNQAPRLTRKASWLHRAAKPSGVE